MREFSKFCSEEFKQRFVERTCSMNRRTADEYVSYVNLICNKLGKDFLQITPQDADRYFAFLNSKLKDGTITRKTIGVRLSCYRTIAQYISDKDSSYISPFLKVVRPSISSDINPDRIPSMEELDVLMTEAKKDPKVFLIMAFATRMALSVSSILSLNISSVVEEDGRKYLFIPSNSDFKKDTYISVPEDVSLLIDSYIGSLPAGEKMFFKNSRGNRMTLNNVDRIIRNLNKACGITDYTLKDYRNRAILEMAANGASADVLCAYTGLSPLRIESFVKNKELVNTICPAELVNYRLVVD